MPAKSPPSHPERASAFEGSVPTSEALDDPAVTSASAAVSARFEALESGAVPRPFREVRDFLMSFRSSEGAPLNVEKLRSELLDGWRARLSDYRMQTEGDHSPYDRNPEMEALCERFLDRDPTRLEFDSFLTTLCVGPDVAPLLLAREDRDFAVTVFAVYASRFAGRIAALSDKLALAFHCYDSGLEAPYVGAHFFPRVVMVRTDISGSMERQSALREGAVRANMRDYSDRVTDLEYHHPALRPMQYAGDEVVHCTDGLVSAQTFLADLQGDTVGRSALALEAAGKEGALVLVITPDNRVLLVGPAYEIAGMHQKRGKRIEHERLHDGVLNLTDAESVVGATLEDADGRMVPMGEGFLREVMSASATSFGMEALDVPMYPSIAGSFHRYRIPDVRIDVNDLNDPAVLQRIVDGIAMTPQNLFEIKVERPTNVKAAFLGVRFRPFEFPQWTNVTPEMVRVYGEACNDFFVRVSRLCEAHEVKPVYEDGQSGFLILGAGIYGSYPLNAEENLARLANAMMSAFPDRVEFFSQTSGEVVQGPVGGDINVSGEPVGYLARLMEKLSLAGGGATARFVLDEPTYRSLVGRGFQLSVVETKQEAVRGLEGDRRFYFVSTISMETPIPDVPHGYEERFEEMASLIREVKGDPSELRRAEWLVSPDMGATERFRVAVADQARLDGYRVLGQHVIPERSRVYGVVQYVLKELFGGNSERFAAFLNAHSPDNAAVLKLFFAAISGENASVDIRAYRDLLISGVVTILKLYSKHVQPLCLFVDDYDDLDDVSRSVLDTLMSDASQDSGGILVVGTRETGTSDVTMAREFSALAIFGDQDAVAFSASEPALPVVSLELGGTDSDASMSSEDVQRMVQLHYDRLPEGSVARHVFSLASFLGEQGPEELLAICLEKDSEMHVSSAELLRAKTLLTRHGFMVFDGDHYRFTQGFIPAAGRRIVGFDRRARNEHRTLLLGTLLEVAGTGRFVPSDLLFDLSRELEVPQRVAPAIRDVVVMSSEKDPLNAESVARRFLSRPFPRFDQFSEEELLAYFDIFNAWIRVSCDLNRPLEALTTALTDLENKIRLLRSHPKGGGLTADFLDSKGYVSYWRKEDEVLRDSVVGLMRLPGEEPLQRVYIEFHKGRSLYRRADRARRGIGGKVSRYGVANRESYDEALALGHEAIRVFSDLCGQLDSLCERDFPGDAKERLDSIRGEARKMLFMVRGLVHIGLPLTVKEAEFLTWDDPHIESARSFMHEVGEYLLDDSGLLPLQRTSLAYIMAEGASLLENFSEYEHVFRGLSDSLREAGHVRAYVEMQQLLFLLAGERAQRDSSSEGLPRERMLSSLSLFKVEMDSMQTLLPLLRQSGILIPFYTNCIEYWEMRLRVEDSPEAMRYCVECAEDLLRLIHDPDQGDPVRFEHFRTFVDQKKLMVEAMRTRYQATLSEEGP